MNEKQPEPYVTIKIYKNGAATIEHEGKTLKTEIQKPDFRSVMAMLGISLILDKTIEGIGKRLNKVLEGQKKDEKKDEPK